MAAHKNTAFTASIRKAKLGSSNRAPLRQDGDFACKQN